MGVIAAAEETATHVTGVGQHTPEDIVHKCEIISTPTGSAGHWTGTEQTVADPTATGSAVAS